MKGNEEEEVTLKVLQDVVLVLLELVLPGQEVVVALSEAVVVLSELVVAQQEALVVFVVHVFILHSKQLLRHWVSVDREPNVPAFTGNSEIKAPLPNNPSTGDNLSLFLNDEFFDIFVEQIYMQQNTKGTMLTCHHKVVLMSGLT